MNQEHEDLLYFVGKPVAEGKSIKISPLGENIIVLSKSFKFEYSNSLKKSSFDQSENVFGFDYFGGILEKRIVYFKEKTKSYLEHGADGAVATFSDRFSLLIMSNYIKNGKKLKDLSMYSITYDIIWKKGESDTQIKFTGMAHCFRLSPEEYYTFSDDSIVFIDAHVPGSVEGAKRVHFVNC